MLSSLDRALALRASTLFQTLSADALLPVAALCTERRLATGDVLFDAGELGDALYIVARGRVRVEQRGKLLANLKAGDCVGEMAALDWEPRSARVVAVEPSLCVRLGRNELMDLLAGHPELVRSLASVLVQRIRKMQA